MKYLACILLLPSLLLSSLGFTNNLFAQSPQPGDFQSYGPIDLGPDRIANGWLALFDGESFFGWRKANNVDWNVANGAITASEGEIGLLRTAAQFDDFILELEFQAGAATNSGVFIRTSPNPKDLIKDCLEINIAPPSNPFPTASIVKQHKTIPVRVEHTGWNAMRIEANGPVIKVQVNDKLVTNFKSPGQSPRKGFIGLQHNSGKASFRNIVVRPLGLQPMLGSNNLSDWNLADSRASEFAIDNSVLKMKNGPGQIESRKKYGNFIFSTHIRTNSIGLNSGVFFRCIPGERMNGYESQIQNQFIDGDRKSPKDAGSGGIFRRQNARLVNSDDEHWFAKTIITDGATTCVWVNGMQVADWTDNRKPDPNPRKGRRLAAGTIILQGHDPTTDVSFKQMRVRELNARR